MNQGRVTCPQCDGKGFRENTYGQRSRCGNCGGHRVVDVSEFQNIHQAVIGRMHGWEPRADALPEPTDTLPGSPERIAVLRQRVDDGTQLWHPDDRMFQTQHDWITRALVPRVTFDETSDGDEAWD